MKEKEDELEKKLKKVEFHLKLELAINRTEIKEKIKELKKIQGEIEGYDDDDKAKLYFELGYYTEDLGEKIKYYDKVIELDPNYKEAYNNRGNAKDDLGNHEEAIKDYNSLIKLDSSYRCVYYNRGLAKFKSGNFKGAIEDYNREIELNPNYIDTYNNRAEIYLKIKEFNVALNDLVKSLELSTEEEFGLDVSQKNYDEFKEFLEKKEGQGELIKIVYRRLIEKEGFNIV